MYKCNNCDKTFDKPFEKRCPNCGSKNWVHESEDECTCPPVLREGQEVCPVCKAFWKERYKDYVNGFPIEGEL